MKALRLYLLVMPLLLFADVHWTEEIPGGFRAAVSLPHSQINLDENLVLHLTLNYPSTHTPDLDTVRMNLLKYIGISEPPFTLKKEELKNDEQGTTEISFFLEPQTAGRHFLSFYAIPFLPAAEKEGDSKEIFSQIFEIEVAPPQIDPEYRGHLSGLLSLSDPLPLSLDFENQQHIDAPGRIEEESRRSAAIVSSRTLPWEQIMGVLLFAVIVFIARMQPKQKRAEEKIAKKTAAGARGKALQALNTLDPLEKQAFYVGLTNTVRTYIEEKYRIKATTRTTQEFLYEMAHCSSFDRETQAALSDFLFSSDRVKFADHNPTYEDSQEALQTAERFINKP